MSFLIRCPSCEQPMTQGEEFDRCDNGACEFAGYEVPHEPDDPAEVNWLDGLEAA